MKPVKIEHTPIGGNHPTYVVAEVGINHNGDADLAWKIIQAAHDSGVDAVKLQNFTTSQFVHPKSNHFSFLKSCELTQDSLLDLIEKAKRSGITIFSTPESLYDLDFLDRVGMPAIKIASMDLNYEALIRGAARLRKPIILSTGMGYLYEVARAVHWIEAEGNQDIVLLHCTSLYPTLPEQANLAAMGLLKTMFDCPVGYSDHTIGVNVACAAVGIGAHMIEKHFTLDKSLPGPDQSGSADSNDIKRMIALIRTLERAKGEGKKVPIGEEQRARLLKRRGIYAAKDLPKGTVLCSDDVVLLTPSTPESQLEDLPRFIGCSLKVDLKEGDLITRTVI